MLAIYFFLEIIKHVLAREQPPFRPDVKDKSCPVALQELMSRCWEESPVKRPCLAHIKKIVKDNG